MKLLLAADGSSYTKKALAWLVTNPPFGGETELVVLNVQTPVPPRVRSLVGAAAVRDFHHDEAVKILSPVERFLRRHSLRWTTQWSVGSPPTEILRVAQRERAHQIVMGTHGRGALGRALLGSVAQGVLTAADVPVLLVR